jgi:hypothetical protein
MQNDTPNDETNPNPIDPIETPALQPIQSEVVQPVPPVTGATQFELNWTPSPAEYPIQDATPALTPFSPIPTSSGIPAEPIGSGPVYDTPLVAPASKKSKKKLIIFGSIIAGALVILGGGSALAYNVWYQNPEKVVTDSLVNALTARTAQLTGSLEVKNDEYKVKMTFDAKAATKNAELAVKVDYTADGQTVKLDGAGHFSADGDLYVKVNNVDSIISTLTGGEANASTAYDALSSKVEGKWIKITSDDIGKFSEDYKKTQGCLEDVTKQVADDKKLGSELVELYKKNNFIVIVESLGARTINDTGSLGYVVDLDTKKAKTFAAGLETTEVGKKLKACDSTIDFKDFADSLDAEDSDETKSEDVIQVWASRFGHELTEINANGQSDGTEIKAVFNPVFNKDVNIDTPTDAMTLESLQAEFEKATEAYYAEYYSELYT